MAGRLRAGGVRGGLCRSRQLGEGGNKLRAQNLGYTTGCGIAHFCHGTLRDCLRVVQM